jgi:outer membrane receptor protein involved in Fe transport
MRNLVVVAAYTLFACGTLMGQFQFGSVNGLVKDPSQSPVPDATVEIRSKTTNVAQRVTTSASGEYTFASLSPDQYTITVQHAGFRTAVRAIQLQVDQRLQADVTLEVGNVTESVTVAAQTALLETASSEVGTVTEEKQVADLPLNTRNFTQLLDLAPGVNNRGTASNSILQGYTSGRGTNGAVINGAPPEGIVYLFDGVQSMDNDAGDIIFFPPVDAIQEFKVQTSSASSAYGGGAGVINVDFKSGTNQFHGVAYEFLRNSAFDAKNFFDSQLAPIPPFRLNQFGFNIGGPVWIPKVFNGKDKLFFFGDYEGKRVFQAQTFISTVPIAAFHTGDFSALLPKTVIYDPRGNGHTPLPGNIIPATAIDATSAKLMALYPAQNMPGNVNNFLYNPGQQTSVDQFDFRFDYRTGASNFFGRMSHENPVTVTPGYLPAPAIGGGPSRPGNTEVPAWQGVIGFGRAISPTIFYEARVGFSRMVEYIVDADSGNATLAQSLGIPNANAGNAGGLTNVSISGTVGLGDGSGSLAKVNNNYEYSQALSWVKGAHELKFGGSIMSRRFSFFSPSYPVGQMAFSGAYSGYGLSDFLFGHPISSDIDITRFFSLHRYMANFYVQDTWRLTPKLTLNVGLRDDVVTPWTERHDLLAGFVPTGGGTLVPVGTAPYTGNSVTEGRTTNVGPRAGLAYNVTPTTVIRAGFGIFYSYAMQTSNDSPAKNPPFSGSLQVSNSASDFVDASPISAGYPAARPALFPIAGLAWIYYPYDFKTQSADEWNFNVQRQLGANNVLTVAYVGAKGTHILVTDNINEALPGPGAVASRRPYPNLGDGTSVGPWGDSTYHSLQATFQRRLSTGLSFLGAWTWSHSIDNSSGTGSEGIQTPYNLALNRGNSTFDVRQSLVLSWTYELPFGRGKTFLRDAHGPLEIIAGGWQLNSIDTFQTGTPFTATMSTSALNAGTGGQWPNTIAVGAASNPTISHWFNTAAFVSPGAYVYGNEGRNSLYGPGTKQVDLSAFKNFRFSPDKAMRAQFRAEVFNIFNTPQFNNPNASIGNLSVGTINSAGQPPLFQRTSREIQVALKLYW